MRDENETPVTPAFMNHASQTAFHISFFTIHLPIEI
jgi:hypothetical protein